jgi:hypothetical protein
MATTDPPPAAPAPREEGKNVADLVARVRDWFAARPLSKLAPRERMVARLDAFLDRDRAERLIRERFDDAFERTVARLRAEKRAPAEIVGRATADALIRGAGDLEPDDATIRSFFAERAVERLIASLVYDGIVEFLKKGFTPVGDRVGGLLGKLGGMDFAKRVAGIAGGAAGFLGDQLEGQVKAFLQVFAKVAVDRAVAFVTAPENRAAFREMRERAVRRALETPVAEGIARVPPERIALAKERLKTALQGLVRDDALRARIREALIRAYDRHGERTLEAVGIAIGIERKGAKQEPPPPDLVDLIHDLLAADAVGAWLKGRFGARGSAGAAPPEAASPPAPPAP